MTTVKRSKKKEEEQGKNQKELERPVWMPTFPGKDT
jgi:hypothetical protein